MTENKKMTITQQRDEWRNLALQERERANNAEALAQTAIEDRERADREVATLRSLTFWWEQHGHDIVFGLVALVAIIVCLYLITR